MAPNCPPVLGKIALALFIDKCFTKPQPSGLWPLTRYKVEPAE
jgi:hypothetical protein